MTGLSLIYLARFQSREQNHAHDDNLKSRFDGFGHLIDNPTVEGFDPSDFAQAMARRAAQAQAHALAQAQARRGTSGVDILRQNCNQLIALRKKQLK